MRQPPNRPPPAGRFAAVGGTLLLLSLAGCRTDRDVQRDFARERLEPTPLASTSTPDAAPPAVRSYRVRAWVGDGYAVGAPGGARSRIEAQVARANQLLEPQFGVRLELADVRPWPDLRTSEGLDGALRALAALDPGAGVDWVFGFVPADVPVVSGSTDPLGRAVLFGGHLVLRDMVMGEERREIEAALRALPEDERERVMTDRRLHRESVVLLHEWAHTLGAFHERAGDSIMNPLYQATAYRFTPAQVRICRLGLASRDAAAPEARAAWARQYRAELEGSRDDAWDEGALEAARDAARRLEATGRAEPSPAAVARPEAARPSTARPGAPAAASPGAPPGAPQPRAAGVRRELVAAAVQADAAARLGDPASAWRRVQPLAAQLGEKPYARTWLCHLQRRARSAERLAPECARLPELAPAVAAALFAHVLGELGDRTGAAAAALRAEQAFAGQRRAPPRVAWAELADLLAEAGACTAAERDAARAPGEELAHRALAACARVRARALLPRGAAGVAVDLEPEYVGAVLTARAALEGGDVAAAAAAGRELSRAFPGAAGGPWLSCVARAHAPAGELEAACREAARAAPWANEPRVLLGVAAGNAGRWEEARQALREALERDPLDLEVWSRLGVACEKLGDTAGLEDLRRRHKERFGIPLALEW